MIDNKQNQFFISNDLGRVREKEWWSKVTFCLHRVAVIIFSTFFKWKTTLIGRYNLNNGIMTRTQINDTFLFQNRVKVKVVGEVSEKWNKPNLMYIYHKQCEIMQKIQWNSSNGQLHWFPIDFLWKSSKMDQNYANVNASRRVAKFFKRYPDMPYESWRPGDSENVVVFYSIIFWTQVIAAQSRVKSQEFFLQNCGVKKNRYGYNIAIQVKSSREKFQNWI